MNSRLVALSIVIVMLVASFTAIAVLPGTPAEYPQKTRISSYTTHAPIVINGNADFASKATANSWPGDGSNGNPYIIQGYDINASSTYGIRIDSVDKHFIISDCLLHDGSYSTSYDGMYLTQCRNGTIRNNVMTNNSHGITLQYCSNFTLDNNTISSSAYTGMHLNYDCDNSTIVNNTCSDNWVGIQTEFSCDNNTIANNFCSDNVRGIFVFISCRDNKLVNNTCTDNSDYGMILTNYCNRNAISGNNCSFNTGYGLYLTNSQNNTLTGNTCSGNGNGLNLYSSSSNNVISNNTVSSNVNYGIYLFTYSSNNTISDNNCQDNQRGIYLLSNCNDNDVCNNTCTGSSLVGIYVSGSCTRNTISDNNCSQNNQGVSLSYSWGNRIVNNTFWWNSGYGILVSDSSGNAMENNSCFGGSYGISVGSSSNNNALRNNSCSDCTYGIVLSYSTGSTLRDNTLVTCGVAVTGDSLNQWGTHSIDFSNIVNGNPVYFRKDLTGLTVPAGYGQIILVNCTDFAISGYSIAFASHGISAAFCSKLLIEDCDLTNDFNGAYLHETDNVTMSNCTVAGGQYCIRAMAVDDSTFTNNTCSGATCGIYVQVSENVAIADNHYTGNYYGMYLYMLVNGTVSGNNCSSNSYGIYLNECYGDLVDRNNCSGNSASAINMYYDDGNRFSNNTCSESNIGLEVDDCRENMFDNNTCSGNNWGIYIYSYGIPDDSSNNTFVSNTLRDNVYEAVFVMPDSYDNVFYGNVFTGNNGAGSVYSASHIQALDDGTRSLWNTSTDGNRWSDWLTPDVAAPFGIVDLPYSISGAAGAKDFYPISSWAPDTAAPNTTASPSGSPGSNGWFRSNVSLVLSGVDSGSGLNKTEYRVNNGTWIQYNGSINLTADGIYFIEYRSTDNNSNAEGIRNLTVMVDMTAPVTSAAKSGSNVTLTASDATSGLNKTFYRVNGGTWQVYNGSFEVTGAGNNTIEYYSVDAAGNAEPIKTTWVENAAITGDIDLVLIMIIIGMVVLVIVVATVLMRRKKTKQSPPQTPPTTQ